MYLPPKCIAFCSAICKINSCSRQERSNEAALKGMHNRLKSIMRPKLPVYVVKVIPKRLRADTKRFGNSRGCGTHREHSEDFKLLRG